MFKGGLNFILQILCHMICVKDGGSKLHITYGNFDLDDIIYCFGLPFELWYMLGAQIDIY
jgi:hypothetical protein